MVKKKKNKYNFWKRLHFKYRLSAVNENTLEEIWKIRTSMFSGGILFLAFAFLLVGLTSALIITTPIRYYLPGYLDSEIRNQAIKSAIHADSLEQQLKYQEAYLNNLREVFAGTVQIDSVKMMTDTVSLSENDPSLIKSQREKEYTQRYEEEERYNLSVLSSATTPSDKAIFFKPAKGIVKDKFDATLQKYGVTVKIASKENVLAALEGTIIFTGYDIDNKYTIQIQHKNGFISIYKYNTMLLKKTGDKVKTGEAIAVIEENKDKSNNEAFLYFELWYKGNPINPEDYISFL